MTKTSHGYTILRIPEWLRATDTGKECAVGMLGSAVDGKIADGYGRTV